MTTVPLAKVHRLTELTVAATVPSGKLSGRLRADTADLVLTFHDNSYYRFTETELAHQIESLARLLSVAWVREYWSAVSDLRGHLVTGEEPALDDAERRYRDLRDHRVLSARSPDGRITIDYHAGHDGLKVDIQDGTLVALREEEFAEAINHTARALFTAHRDTVLRIRHECFPPPERLPVW